VRKIDKPKAREIVTRRIEGKLAADDILLFYDFALGTKTVAEVLDDPDTYVNKPLADPQEGPRYGAQCAMVLRRPNGTWFIKSFAHGGINYELNRDDYSHLLRDLALRAATNPKTLFTIETLAALAALSQEDSGAYETLRGELKAVLKAHGMRIRALDAAVAKVNPRADDGPKQSQTDILQDIVDKYTHLFQTGDMTAYADVMINGRRETFGVKSKTFRLWLTNAYYDESDGKGASMQSLATAINAAEAGGRAGPEYPVFLRVGGHGGKIYLDLCNKAWRAIEIDAGGWRIVGTPPIRFRRCAGMLALPEPVGGGKIEELREFVNAGSDGDFVLIVAWLLAAVRDRGPYPGFGGRGEEGTGKSSTERFMRLMIDPHSVLLRKVGKDDRNFFIAADNSWVCGLDNLGGLPADTSDSLCGLSTGAGYATRELYTDGDEKLITAKRPWMLNGIADVITRPDLASRAVLLDFPEIPEDERREENELEEAFFAARPRMLGALLDGMVWGLKNYPTTKLARKPRMADFARWVSACETAYWPAGTFIAAYTKNAEDALATLIGDNAVAQTLCSLMIRSHNSAKARLAAAIAAVEKAPDAAARAKAETEKVAADAMATLPITWGGTATELLDKLSYLAGKNTCHSKYWPKEPHTLSYRLRTIAKTMRKVGIDIDAGNYRTNKKRQIEIRLVAVSDIVEKLATMEPPTDARFTTLTLP
jgi:hypothetical protein